MNLGWACARFAGSSSLLVHPLTFDESQQRMCTLEAKVAVCHIFQRFIQGARKGPGEARVL